MTATPGLVRWLKLNAVGAAGICVQLAALALLTYVFGVNYLLATTLAVEAAVLHNFIWHERFTWSDRQSRPRLQRLLKFNLSTGLVSVLGNMLTMKLLVTAGLRLLPANVLSIAACSVANYLIADRVIFLGAPGNQYSRSRR